MRSLPPLTSAQLAIISIALDVLKEETKIALFANNDLSADAAQQSIYLENVVLDTEIEELKSLINKSIL